MVQWFGGYRMARSAVQLVALVVVLPLVGCSDDDGTTCPVDLPDSNYEAVFDPGYGIVFTISPDTLVRNEQAEIFVKFLPNYPGVGRIGLRNYSPNGPIGRIVDPVRADLGSVVVPIHFNSGIPTVVPLRFLPTPSEDSIHVIYSVEVDSVEIDGQILSVEEAFELPPNQLFGICEDIPVIGEL